MPPTPKDTIDLHGYRKEQAIAQVTLFLERVVRENSASHTLWVCIITGSGSHSHQGPVLREAVRSLLDKREMEYSLQQGKGAFIVNACSGHELVAAPACKTDSKVVVKGERKSDVRLVNRVPPRRVVPQARAPPNQRRIRSLSASRAAAAAAAAPLPSEVAADDSLIEKVKSQSAQEHTQSLQRENRELKRAISASQLELLRERREEEERMAEVLLQSREEEERLRREEEERLAAALERSQLEEEVNRREKERIQREEEEKLNAILHKTRVEEEQQRRQEEILFERALSVSQTSPEDKELEEALAQSIRETGDNELDQALSLSLKETSPEDELLQQVLQMSMKQTGVVEDVPDDEDVPIVD